MRNPDFEGEIISEADWQTQKLRRQAKAQMACEKHEFESQTCRDSAGTFSFLRCVKCGAIS